MAETYDLIILGSGPGGYVAAIRAKRLRPDVPAPSNEPIDQRVA